MYVDVRVGVGDKERQERWNVEPLRTPFMLLYCNLDAETTN